MNIATSTLAAIVVIAGLALGAGPAPFGALPTPQQLQWQRGELTLFLHFGVNTFTGREWGDGKEDPKVFNPTKLDARQWAKAAKAGGFTLAILTAKHHDGFCLWPSRYTEHSVKSSPWKDGKGDVVREFCDAFRAEGIRIGLYLSPWDRNAPSYGDSPRYNDLYCNQLTELLTNYAPVYEVWFDGACGEGPNGRKQVYDFPRFWGIVRKLAPDAVIFSDAGPDVRWIGNEQGIAGDPCWSTVDPAVWLEPGKAADGARDPIKRLQHGDRGGTVWRPGESDVSIRPGWFYHPQEDSKVRSVENLVDLYFKSVGRNSLLLLNVPPNREGLLSDVDVRRLAEFKARRDEVFRHDLCAGRGAMASNAREGFGSAKVTDGDVDSFWAVEDGITSGWVEVDLGRPVKFNIACIQEAIALGQRVEEYHIEYLDGGDWQTLAKGTTIGHKKLDRFKTVTAQRVRLVIDKALACPTVAAFSLYFDELTDQRK